MNAEMLHVIPTTEQRAKMAYVYIRQSSLMQVTRHAESTDLQYALVERAVALGWPRERVELIDEDLGKSGAQAQARGGFQRLLAEISLARVGLVLSFDASRLARNNRDWYQLRAASARSLAPSLPTANDSTIPDSTMIDYCWGYQA
jgi:DNA invertase Pin-like site-specific DNA recombinase